MKPQQSDFRRILPILVIILIDAMGLTIIIPILPYYALAFDASPFVIGLLISSYPLMQFFFVPVLGALSDRVGRKPVLVAAQIGTFISLITLGLANGIFILFFARIIDGITGANLATVQSAITDSTSPQNRAKGLGLVGATFGLGFILGPMLSGLTLRLSGNSYSAPAFVAAGFALASILLTIFLFKETLPSEKRSEAKPRWKGLSLMVNALSDPVLGILFLLMFIQQMIFSNFMAIFAPFTLTRLGLDSFGNTIFFAVFGVVLVVVQGRLIGPLSRQFGERRLIYIGLSLFALGLVLSSFTPEQPVPWYSREALVLELSQTGGAPPTEQLTLLPAEANQGMTALIYLLLVLTLIPTGFGLLKPSLNSLITKRANPGEVGRALGVSAAFVGAGTVIGPSLGGYLFSTFGPAVPFIVNGLTALLLLLVALHRLTPQPQDIAIDPVR